MTETTSTQQFRSTSAEETRAFAAAFIRERSLPVVIALHGDLGSGKTCFVQGLARALGVRSVVNSPTYTLINEYTGTHPLFHIDLYRVSGLQEALALGPEEYFERDGVTAIEWAERVEGALPAHAVHVRLAHGAEPEHRLITVEERASPP